MQIPDDFGERVRARRTDIGWSAAALSRRCAADEITGMPKRSFSEAVEAYENRKEY
jgi:ribosome-binding protein aMBF1 (putative translation factor)